MGRARDGTVRDEKEVGNRQGRNEGTSEPGDAGCRKDHPTLTLDQCFTSMKGYGPTPDSESATSRDCQQGPMWSEIPFPLVRDFPKSHV